MGSGRAAGILRYELATVAVYDPVAMNRNATRNTLYALGFREIESFPTVEDLRRAVQTRSFDLIVAEAAKADDPLFPMIAKIRRSELGRNPFAVVMITTWMPEGQAIAKGLDGGADDIMCRPFSTAQLNERLRTHILSRKKFVVTSDYVGPDRRDAVASRESAMPLLEVVNSLQMKTVEGLSGYQAQAAIENAVAEGRARINTERMRRLAFQIGIVAGFVEQQARDMTEQGVRRADLDKIVAVAREIQDLAATEGVDHAAKTAVTIVEVATKASGGDDIALNARILVRLSVTLQVTLSPDLSESICRAELDDTLERVKARLRA